MDIADTAGNGIADTAGTQMRDTATAASIAYWLWARMGSRIVGGGVS